MSDNTFTQALRNFTMDAAAGDAIRHLTDKGYSPAQIKEMITYPAPMEYIYSVMWERLVATGKVVPAEKVSEGTVLFDTFFHSNSNSQRDGEKVSKRTVPSDTFFEIIEHRDRYGRKSFVRVKKESPEEMVFSPEDYVQYENFFVLKSALEQVSSLSGHIPLKDRSTGSHRDT